MTNQFYIETHKVAETSWLGMQAYFQEFVYDLFWDRFKLSINMPPEITDSDRFVWKIITVYCTRS